MPEEGNISKRAEKARVDLDLSKPVNHVSNYKHHKIGNFNCEAEVEQNGKIVCCLHDPVTGEWKWPVKGVNE